MTTPQVVQINIALTAATRVIRRSIPASGLRDTSLVVKTVLAEALGGLAVKPWRVHAMRGGVATVVGYSTEQSLAPRLELALPELRGAIELFASPIPELLVGQRLRFRTRFVPTVRVDKFERDAFLTAMHKSEQPVFRANVYQRYVVDRLKGADIRGMVFDGFSLREFVRPQHLPDSRRWKTFTLPVAEVSGALSVADPDAFRATLLRGIGRHGSYGFGYIRLEADV